MVPAVTRDNALFLDFDGTLVEIAETPGSVRVDTRVPQMLIRAAARLNGALAVISGRSLQDLECLLKPYRGAAAGIHGLERRTISGTVIRDHPVSDIGRVRERLGRLDERSLGIRIEDKGLSLALHYRLNPESAAACLELAREAVALSARRLSVLHGKMVVEIVPRQANKGSTVLSYLKEAPFACRRPIFAGDDHTDEDAFDIVNRLGGISVHVGRSRNTAASHRLTDVPAVMDWLAGIGGPPPSSAPGKAVGK